MRNRDINKEIDRINLLISRSKVFIDSNEFEALSDWSKYICVVVSGFMENSLETLFSEYAKKQLSGPVCNFVISSLRINNPKTQRFYEVMLRFNQQWKEDLTHYVVDGGRDDALDTIMNNRHLIVHGRSKDSRITLVQVKESFKKCIEILNFIEDKLQLT